MRRGAWSICVLAVAIISGEVASAQVQEGTAQKVVIPFDFESQFDDGRYGQIIGDLVWSKLRREGGVVLPETMQDVRDWCERTKTLPNPETPLESMQKIVREEQAGDIAVWGKVERVEGNQYDVYDLWIKVADFSGESPRILYDKKARTETVSEIPHVHIKEALETILGREILVASGARDNTGRTAGMTPAQVLLQSDFEKGAGSPAGWDPLPAFVTWVGEQGANPPNRVIRFTLSEAVAGSTGVLYYSEFFPVQAGSSYRFGCRWRSSGSAAKVFIKCYDELGTKFDSKDPLGLEKREVYRNQQNLKGPAGAWNTQTEDFTPKHARFTPKWGRVMLYAYWPAGVVEWDDVRVTALSAAKPGESPSPSR